MAGYGYRLPSYGAFPTNGTPEERMAWAEKTAALPKVTPERVMGSKPGPLQGNSLVASSLRRIRDSMGDRYIANQAYNRNPDISTAYKIGRNLRDGFGYFKDLATALPMYQAGEYMFENGGDIAAGFTGQAPSVPVASQSAGFSEQRGRADRNVANKQAQANATVSQTGAAVQDNPVRPSITIGGKKYPLKGEPSGINRVNMDDGGVMVWGHTGGDDTRNFQYAIRHEPVRRRSAQQAQPQQPRGLHYVPGGWANGGYSFEGSAEDRARFFAPVSGPGRAPRSDNDTFLALQRQKAMQPVEQPLPERPEFPTDRRMGWHTKLAKYQADMDAYNRQMANIAGYRQAMDVAALQQMPKPTDPVEQARLERALALQERQAAQQAAYQQAQLDQRDREMVQNYLNSMPERQVQAARLGYQAMTNQAASDLLDAYRSGDQARIARAGAVWNALNNTSEKKENADKWEVHKLENGDGNKELFTVNPNTGEAKRINVDSLDARVKEAKQALLKDIGRYDQNNPEVKKLVAAVESAETLEELQAVQEGMRSIGK